VCTGISQTPWSKVKSHAYESVFDTGIVHQGQADTRRDSLKYQEIRLESVGRFLWNVALSETARHCFRQQRLASSLKPKHMARSTRGPRSSVQERYNQAFIVVATVASNTSFATTWMESPSNVSASSINDVASVGGSRTWR
jgi:hypothetical protein